MSEESADPLAVDPNAPIPWYRSRIIQRLALSLVMQLVVVFHLSKYFTDVNMAVLVDDLLELVGIASAGWALHARVVKPVPPVVLTKAAAEKAASTPFAKPPETSS